MPSDRSECSADSAYQHKTGKPAGAPKKSARGPAPKPKRDTSTAAASPATSHSANAAAPPNFDFGKVKPGSRRSLSIPIFNLSPTPVAAVMVSYKGDPAIRIQSAPRRLDGAGNPLSAAQNVELVFDAPAARGTHHGRVTIHLVWVGGEPAPESLAVPVIAHAMHEEDQTPQEEARAEQQRRQDRTEAAAKAEYDVQAKRELERFDAMHPSFGNNEFDDERENLRVALAGLERLQAIGIETAEAEVMKYRKAPPPKAAPSLMFDLAMLVLDIASASLAGKIAKSIEVALVKRAAAVPVTIGSKLVAAPIAETGKALGHLTNLAAPSAVMITDGVKEALKGSGKLARKRLGAGSGSAAIAPSTASDTRIAFFQGIKTGNVVTALDRQRGVIRTTALLRPILYRDPQEAKSRLKGIVDGINAALADASNIYADEAVRQWVNFIARPHLDRNKVAAVGDRGIGEARGVLDIGFQAGRSPHDPVTVRSAIIRGVSNDVARRFWEKSGSDIGIPVRAYGVPSPHHAELLVTVVREADGTVQILDDSNGAAPGPGGWLAQKGDGDAMKGAMRMLERELLNRSMLERGLPVTTDQDPAIEKELG